MAYESFIDDPEHIRAVDRERFVVLRPTALLRKVHKQLQALLRQHFASESISYPAQPHVTLAAFAAGTDLGAVQNVIESWARSVPALRITVDTIACFPAPSQIVIIRVVKTPELLTALSRLRWNASQAKLKIDTTISPKDWIFHMSVGYCWKINGPAWNDMEKFVGELKVPSASCVVNDVDVVAFDDHREYSGGVYGLRTNDNVSRRG